MNVSSSQSSQESVDSESSYPNKRKGESSQELSTQVKAKSKSLSKVNCEVCGKESPSVGALKNHETEHHDGRRGRDNPLRCKWCDTTVGMTRKGLSKHVLNCVEVLKEQFPISCLYCSSVCESVHGLSVHAGVCHSWEEDRSQDEKILEEFDKELMRVTRHPYTSVLVKQFFTPAQVRLPDGTTEMALIMPNLNKRLRDGSTVRVRVLDFPEPSVDKEPTDVKSKLDAVLESHSFGRLVHLPDYKPLDNKDPVWHLPFPDHGERLATMLEGLIIHSGVDVLLVLKLEIYGTADYEDAHAQDVAKPEGARSFEVVNTYHDSTHKVMIGTIKWCALVTLAVMLTDGTVIVGPNNKKFEPNSNSCIWIKRDPGPFMHNTMPRQLRSKFYDQSTFASYAAVHELLNHHSTMPVTLKTLYGFKFNKAPSGIKVAAFVFHQLYNQRKIVKCDVLDRVVEAFDRKDKPCELLSLLQNMTLVMRDEEVMPVSKIVNKILTEIAKKLSSEITNINHTEVLFAVEKKLKGMLTDKK